MSGLTDLPADQHAVLSLLVRQGRRYAQVASLLGIDEAAVRGRAQRALVALGDGPAVESTVKDFERVGDYLLGQLDDAERIETLSLLLDSAPARAWARTVSGQLAPLAKVPLPAVPDEDPDSDSDENPRAGREADGLAEADAPAARPARQRRRSTPPAERTARRAGEPPAERTTPRASEPPAEGTTRRASEPPAKRAPRRAAAAGAEREHRRSGAALDRGAGVLLASAAVLIAAIVVFVASAGGSSTPATGPIPASAATQTTTTATGTSTNSAGVLASVALTPTAAGSKASGGVEIVNTGSALEIAFSATDLPAAGSGHYVLWLDNSSTQFEALGELKTISANGSVGPVGVALPSDASKYHGVELTLETSSQPTSPGQVVLSGTSSSAL